MSRFFKAMCAAVIFLSAHRASAGWQRDMVEGTPPPASAPVYAPAYTGPSAEQLAAQQAAAAQQAQRQAAAHQAHVANDAGLSFWNRHEWGQAVQSFRQALERAPGDKVIRSNLARATEKVEEGEREQKRTQEDASLASQMSATLQRMSVATPDFDGKHAGASAGGNTAGLDFMPTGKGTPPMSAVGVPATGGAQPSAVPWQDTSVVDLRGTTKTSVDPASLKGDVAGALATPRKIAPPPPPPAPGVQMPQNEDMEFLMPPPPAPKSAWPGARRPANEPKLVNPLDEEQKTKALAAAIFETPAMDDLMLKGMTDYAEKHPSSLEPIPAPSPKSALEKSAGPHN